MRRCLFSLVTHVNDDKHLTTELFTLIHFHNRTKQWIPIHFITSIHCKSCLVVSIVVRQVGVTLWLRGVSSDLALKVAANTLAYYQSTVIRRKCIRLRLAGSGGFLLGGFHGNSRRLTTSTSSGGGM